MMLSAKLRGVAILAVSTALAGGQGDNATAQDLAPLDPSECDALARTASQAVGIALKTTVGRPSQINARGTACLMSGNATGLTLDFENMRRKVEASLARAGWTAVADFDADGPDSTQKGFTKASQRVVYALSTEPPQGTCESVPLVDCKIPRRRWTWSLTLSAFVQ